jgi:hypothetical protein
MCIQETAPKLETIRPTITYKNTDVTARGPVAHLLCRSNLRLHNVTESNSLLHLISLAPVSAHTPAYAYVLVSSIIDHGKGCSVRINPAFHVLSAETFQTRLSS